MPRKKEDLALAWLQKSEEEKTLIRQKNAERMRLARAKNGIKKRSEMTPQELVMVRTKDRRLKREKKCLKRKRKWSKPKTDLESLR